MVKKALKAYWKYFEPAPELGALYLGAIIGFILLGLLQIISKQY